jgi:hypothetical protein
VSWVALILVPAWSSYGRIWEKLAASFLSVYILVALAGIGMVLGVALIFYYPSFF